MKKRLAKYPNQMKALGCREKESIGKHFFYKVSAYSPQISDILLKKINKCLISRQILKVTAVPNVCARMLLQILNARCH